MGNFDWRVGRRRAGLALVYAAKQRLPFPFCPLPRAGLLQTYGRVYPVLLGCVLEKYLPAYLRRHIVDISGLFWRKTIWRHMLIRST